MKSLPEKIWICPSCGYWTHHGRWLLKNHLMRMHGLKQKQAEITAANLQYKREESSNPINGIVIASPRKRYACPFCEFRSNYTSSLRRHLRLRHGVEQ